MSAYMGAGCTTACLLKYENALWPSDHPCFTLLVIKPSGIKLHATTYRVSPLNRRQGRCKHKLCKPQAPRTAMAHCSYAHPALLACTVLIFLLLGGLRKQQLPSSKWISSKALGACASVLAPAIAELLKESSASRAAETNFGAHRAAWALTFAALSNVLLDLDTWASALTIAVHLAVQASQLASNPSQLLAVSCGSLVLTAMPCYVHQLAQPQAWSPPWLSPDPTKCSTACQCGTRCAHCSSGGMWQQACMFAAIACATTCVYDLWSELCQLQVRSAFLEQEFCDVFPAHVREAILEHSAVGMHSEAHTPWLSRKSQCQDTLPLRVPLPTHVPEPDAWEHAAGPHMDAHSGRQALLDHLHASHAEIFSSISSHQCSHGGTAVDSHVFGSVHQAACAERNNAAHGCLHQEDSEAHGSASQSMHSMPALKTMISSQEDAAGTISSTTSNAATLAGQLEPNSDDSQSGCIPTLTSMLEGAGSASISMQYTRVSRGQLQLQGTSCGPSGTPVHGQPMAMPAFNASSSHMCICTNASALTANTNAMPTRSIVQAFPDHCCSSSTEHQSCAVAADSQPTNPAATEDTCEGVGSLPTQMRVRPGRRSDDGGDDDGSVGPETLCSPLHRAPTSTISSAGADLDAAEAPAPAARHTQPQLQLQRARLMRAPQQALVNASAWPAAAGTPQAEAAHALKLKVQTSSRPEESGDSFAFNQTAEVEVEDSARPSHTHPVAPSACVPMPCISNGHLVQDRVRAQHTSRAAPSKVFSAPSLMRGGRRQYRPEHNVRVRDSLDAEQHMRVCHTCTWPPGRCPSQQHPGSGGPGAWTPGAQGSHGGVGEGPRTAQLLAHSISSTPQFGVHAAPSGAHSAAQLVCPTYGTGDTDSDVSAATPAAGVSRCGTPAALNTPRGSLGRQAPTSPQLLLSTLFKSFSRDSAGSGPVTPLARSQATSFTPSVMAQGPSPPLAARWHPQCTILFSDIVNFTPMSQAVEPQAVMALLNNLFQRFDSLCSKYQVYKVETIGDCYMCVTGLPVEDEQHAVHMVEFAMEMLQQARHVLQPHNGCPVSLRVGIHSGKVMSGVISQIRRKFALFGDTVNTAARMESSGLPGRIHVSYDTYALVRGDPRFQWSSRGELLVKGKGRMETFLQERCSDCGTTACSCATMPHPSACVLPSRATGSRQYDVVVEENELVADEPVDHWGLGI